MDYFTKKNLMIGGAVLVVVIIIIVVVKMKKEKFVLNGSGFVAASGTSATPMAPLTYLTADASGNLSTSADGSFGNISATGGVYLNGYPGNVGDVIVSNGPTTPPVWAPVVTGSLTKNGYQIFPGGLIIQWGITPILSGNVTVPFPNTFPNNIFTCTATQTYDGFRTASGLNSILLSNFTTTGFGINTGGDDHAVNWIAIGN